MHFKAQKGHILSGADSFFLGLEDSVSIHAGRSISQRFIKLLKKLDMSPPCSAKENALPLKHE